MLTPDELRALLTDLESDRIERTLSTKDTDKFSEAVCAFANDLPNHQKPGYLLIGVKNDGTLSQLQVTDELLCNLADLRSAGNIQPIPALNVYKMSLSEGDVAVVEVHPSDLPPVRYKGRVCIRIGPRKAYASEQEERLLSERRSIHTRTFDATPCLGSSVQDLSLNLFYNYRSQAVSADVIAENHRTVEEQLISLRFLDLPTKRPTHAGILLFGQNPRFWLPGAYVQFLALDGTELTDPILDQVEISGDLQTLLRELETRISVWLKQRLQSVSILREKTISEYPERAIRELLMNAVMHRNYESNAPIRFYWFSDRIEIQNPGGLFGMVTPENIFQQNDYRNPVLAEAMKTLGFVNRFGYGLQMAEKALEDNGNPPLSYDFQQNHVLFKIFRRQL